jgi:hypothetical protein
VPEAAVAGNVVSGAEDVPAVAEVPEPAEAEPTQAEVTDAEPTHADEAQARVDEVTGDQRDA